MIDADENRSPRDVSSRGFASQTRWTELHSRLRYESNIAKNETLSIILVASSLEYLSFPGEKKKEREYIQFPIMQMTVEGGTGRSLCRGGAPELKGYLNQIKEAPVVPNKTTMLR